ncbi:MAG: membrane integrity-associated transporter subunit PqiC [Betaproteobacteria bacterium]|uniref:Membrane integrity-associated transporter subunit PqiC n=1 Tax=Candidatus Proximibacter danicus TaxID=2954365 RepID=A0A9D7K2R8_9PROT|nr:membrane integrity-associated transporter subunit PqiC [Candidatus Proximibacter danicus]
MSRKFFLTPVHLVPALLLIFTLAGCGSVPPAPADNFYRLQTPAASATNLSVAVEIRRVQADSLYAERPIVYSEAGNLRQLRQYHYHLWLYPPAQMLRDALRSQLPTPATASGKTVTLDARIVAFDRVVSGSNSSAQAALEVTVTSGNQTLIEKRYQAEQASSDATLTAFVVAMEGALGRIYAEVARDMAEKAAR